jgi:hypothetical protein
MHDVEEKVDEEEEEELEARRRTNVVNNNLCKATSRSIDSALDACVHGEKMMVALCFCLPAAGERKT